MPFEKSIELVVLSLDSTLLRNDDDSTHFTEAAEEAGRAIDCRKLSEAIYYLSFFVLDKQVPAYIRFQTSTHVFPPPRLLNPPCSKPGLQIARSLMHPLLDVALADSGWPTFATANPIE